MNENSKGITLKGRDRECKVALSNEYDDRYMFAANAVFNPKLISVPSGANAKILFDEMRRDRTPEKLQWAAATLISSKLGETVLKALEFNLDVILSAPASGATALRHAQKAARRGFIISPTSLRLKRGLPHKDIVAFHRDQRNSMKVLVDLVIQWSVDCALNFLDANPAYLKKCGIRAQVLTEALAILRGNPKDKNARKHVRARLFLLSRRARRSLAPIEEVPEGGKAEGIDTDIEEASADKKWLQGISGNGLHFYTAQIIWKCCMSLDRFTEKELISAYLKATAKKPISGSSQGRIPVRRLLAAARKSKRIGIVRTPSPNNIITYAVRSPGDSK